MKEDSDVEKSMAQKQGTEESHSSSSNTEPGVPSGSTVQ